MSSSNITARDRVWAAIFEQEGRFQVADVREAIGQSDRPSDETIRRVLRSATKLGTVTHQSGSLYYWLSSGSMAGYPNLSTDEIIGRTFLDPEGIDADEDIDQFPTEKMEDVIYKERDEIGNIISKTRASQFTQSGLPEGHYITPRPTTSKEWRSAFQRRFKEADYIVIIDISTGDLVDISKHLGLDRFEQGTKILAIDELRKPGAQFTSFLYPLYAADRSDLEYQDLSNGAV